MLKLLKTAIYWNAIGLPTIPVQFLGKKALVNWREYQNRLPSVDELKTWFWKNMLNIGLITGNGLVVIDFDVMQVFDYWLPGFLAQYPMSTYMVKTRRGVHVYLHTEEPASNHHTELLDVKAERGYVLIPPSVHPSGYQYEAMNNLPILSVHKLEDVLPECYLPAEATVDEYATTQYERESYDDPFEAADHVQPTQSIDEIRARVPILSLLPDAEASDRSGRWFVASCPFHADAHPSFWVDTEQGICGCHKCNIKVMDVIDLHARMHHLSNKDAIRELSAKF